MVGAYDLNYCATPIYQSGSGSVAEVIVRSQQIPDDVTFMLALSNCENLAKKRTNPAIHS
jgi:hypothetical protein